MDGFRQIAALSLFLFLSNTALSAPSPKTFSNNLNADLQKHLTQLNREFEQFKKRESTLPEAQKEEFQKSVGTIDSQLKTANQFVSDLTEKSKKSEREKTQKALAGIEKELDQAESHFTEKDLGLGSLLGF